MKLLKKKSAIILMIIGLVGILAYTLGFNFAKIKSVFVIRTLSDIAYDVNPSYGYTVYIRENNKYVPYLVLTNNYENTNMALVLRKNIIGSGEVDTARKNCWEADSYKGTKPFSENHRYDKTKMDYFLNNDFIKLFDTEISSIIDNTNIEIEYLLDDSMRIKRKVFLLSTSELGYFKDFDLFKLKLTYGYANEGKPLKYFKDSNDKRATLEDEKTIVPWWTRTYGSSYYCAVGFDEGLITESSTDEYYGVRPAFCIPNTTVIEKSNSILSEQNVYVIESNK